MTTLRKVNFIPVGNEIELAKKWKFNSDHHNCVLEAGSIIKITKVSLYGYHRVHFRCKYSTDGERPKGVFRISLEDANKIYYFENKKEQINNDDNDNSDNSDDSDNNLDLKLDLNE